MSENDSRPQVANTSLVLGGALILLGVVFLLGQLFHIDIGHFAWPFFIIIPGALLYAVSLTGGGSGNEALAVVGSIVTGTGVLLFYQNLTGLWASWAYAWALIFPTAIGLGLMFFGVVRGQPDKVKTGRQMAGIGLVIFVVGAAFFELLIDISGFGLGPYGWPLLLIGLGVFWLLSGLIRTRNR